MSAVARVVVVVVDAIVTALGAVVETVESIVGWVLSAVATPVMLLFSVPVLGRLLRWIWDLILTVVWAIVALLDTLLGVIGIRPEKKLRICVVMLNDESGAQLAPPATIVPQIQAAIDIFRTEANVRVIPSGPFKYTSGFADPETASESWIDTGDTPKGRDVLDVHCDTPALGEDLLTTGSQFEYLAATRCFYGNWRRLTGYGAPIVVFIVRDVGGKIGCSIGPLSDYCVVTASNPICVAHEIGHSCDLWHNSAPDNLMNPACGQVKLKGWQKAVMRTSRHVTYL